MATSNQPDHHSLPRLLRQATSEALAVVADGRATPRHREQAARLVTQLVAWGKAADPSNEPSDAQRGGALRGALLEALGRALELPRVVRQLARAVRDLSLDEAGAAIALLELAERARRGSLPASAFELVSAVLTIETVELSPALRRCAAGFALEQCDKLRLLMLVLRWSERFGADDFVRTAIAQHPELLQSPLLCDRTVIALHLARPTASGWLVVARRTGAAPLPPPVLRSLLRRSHHARRTLDQAIDAVGAHPVRDTLVGWRSAPRLRADRP